MTEQQASCRFLRDNAADGLQQEVQVLIDKVIRLAPEAATTVGHISEAAQNHIDFGRDILEKVEATIEALRHDQPDTDDAIQRLVSVAEEAQCEQNEVLLSLKALMHTLLDEQGVVSESETVLAGDGA